MKHREFWITLSYMALLCACSPTITTGEPNEDEGEVTFPNASEESFGGTHHTGAIDERREPADEPAPPAVPWANPANPFGIGLVGTGTSMDWNRASELAGAGGLIKLIFAGVSPGMTTALPNWIEAVEQAYALDLVPVIRVGPQWGDMNIRSYSDDSDHMHYDTLAATYASVISSLPRRENWPLVIELHNEANLCYEWLCSEQDAKAHPDVPSGWMHYTDMAAEYAAFLRDVSVHIEAIGDPRILLLNGGLAPGGVTQCACDGDGFTPGITSIEFIHAMKAAVPDVFDRIDAWASHPYPARGPGWGFFEEYDDSIVGLHYYESELAAIGLDLPVYITETGWSTTKGAQGSRDDIATWTVQAFENDWLPDPRVVAVMPFMLRDSNWDSFSWVNSGGSPHPVFGAVKSLRCQLQDPGACTN